MSEVKIKTQVAYQLLLVKLKATGSKTSFGFLDTVMWNRAPLSYIETHYNLHSALSKFQPDHSSRSFEGDFNVADDVTAFFGDLKIKGNLTINSGQRMIIVGHLIVDGVVDIETEARLFTGGSIVTSAIRIAGERTINEALTGDLIEIPLMADTIECREMLIANSNIYCRSVKTKLLVRSHGSNFNFSYLQYENGEFIRHQVEVEAHYQSYYPPADITALSTLFRKEIFGDGYSADPINDAFDALKRIDNYLDDDFLPVRMGWIWKME